MARLFNGSTDAISCGTAINIPGGNAWSASAWIYMTSLPSSGNFMGIFSKRDLSGACFEIFIHNVSGTTGFGAYNGSVFNQFGNLSTNTWYQVVAACDATSFIAYINGTIAGTDAANYNAATAPSQAVYIGTDNANGGGSGNDLAGRIADVALWNNVKLTAGEAAGLAVGARPWTIRPAALVAWFPLNGLSSPEPDFSGFAHNGTLTGTTNAFGPPTMMFTPRWPQFSAVAASTIKPYPPFQLKAA